MQPQQPYTNPYDFIVNPEKPPRKPLLSLNSSSMGIRIAVIVAVVAIVIMLLLVVLSLFSSKGGNVVNMTSVAQDQQELIRVATEATQNQSNSIAQNTTLYFADNCLLGITSAQQKLLAFLSSNGVKLSAQQLALKQNPHTDQILTAAVASSTYDSAFLGAMQGDMNTYITDIKTAYAASQSPQEKKLLQGDYRSAQLLNQQLTSAVNNVNAGT